MKTQVTEQQVYRQVETQFKHAAQRLEKDKYCDVDALSNNDCCNYEFTQDSPVEYEENCKPVRVKGRLRSHINFWQHIGASKFILDTISRGYIIPFVTTPKRARFCNNKTAFEHSDFVTSAISELVQAGLVKQCMSPPTVVNPLSVSVQSSGKKRLILDLRYPNESVRKSKITFEDSKSMLNVLTDCPQNWLYSFDIKSGYHHVDIFPDDWQFLGFSWVFNGVCKYYVFTVLPFGLSTGPYIFTKIMRPLVKHWRSKTFKIVVYLDDGLGVCPSFTSCEEQSLCVKSDLCKSGFVANVEKSIWEPTQCTKWLGLNWDLKAQILTVPQDKVARLLAKIHEALALKKISARQLASVTGLIISNMIVFGNICKLMTKSLHRKLDTRSHWNSVLVLDQDSIRELTFWVDAIPKLNQRSLVMPNCLPATVVYSDASSTGCAAYVSINGTPMCHKNWNEIEMKQSSTWRELKCVQYALECFAQLLSNKTVKWFTDNQAVKFIVESGSMKLHLHKLAVDIFNCSKKFNVALDVEWIPRTQNEKADYMSKIIDFEDWKIKQAYFDHVATRWGQCTIDCFANSENRKVSRFYSKWYNPGTLGVDCFSFSWAGEFCWLVPPISLIPRAIKHVLFCKCSAVLVVPVWPSSVFWPFLLSREGYFRSFVVDWWYVKDGKQVYEHGANKNCLFGSKYFNGAVAFLLLDGARG